MKYADKAPCDIVMFPEDERYAENIRLFQGCPSIAITHGGRIFLAWYSGGTCEPHMDNYNLLIYSDDLGKTWSKIVLVIPSNKEKLIHALDIQLWTAPDGRLFVFWVQNNTKLHVDGSKALHVDGYDFDDFKHSEWRIICDDPDSKELLFSEPECLDSGFLRCKPLVLSNGRWINFNYDQINEHYGYSISDDCGRTYTRHYGARKLASPFDEPMAYEMKDGTIRMLARTSLGELAQTFSHDNARTWETAELSGIDSPNTRFFISRTPSGNVLLVNNDHREYRTNMTIYLSVDDGKTWKYKRLIDTRPDLSYPDVDFYGGRIYLTYDRERYGAREILILDFTEQDITDESYTFTQRIVSKP